MKIVIFVLTLIMFGYMVGNESALACDTAAVGYASCNVPVQTFAVQAPVYSQQLVAIQPSYATVLSNSYGYRSGDVYRIANQAQFFNAPRPRVFVPRPRVSVRVN